MREILFRGKCVSDGHWVHGLLISIGGELSMLTSNNGLDRAYPVLSETIGQYIGLTDKNGEKIYEGDIIVVSTSEKGKTKKYRVEFDNGIFGIRFPAHAYNNTIIPLRSFDYIEIIKGEEND